MSAINIIMSCPPGPRSQFIEIEDDNGQSINVGKWSPVDPHHPEGWWSLRIEALPGDQPPQDSSTTGRQS